MARSLCLVGLISVLALGCGDDSDGTGGGGSPSGTGGSSTASAGSTSSTATDSTTSSGGGEGGTGGDGGGNVGGGGLGGGPLLETIAACERYFSARAAVGEALACDLTYPEDPASCSEPSYAVQWSECLEEYEAFYDCRAEATSTDTCSCVEETFGGTGGGSGEGTGGGDTEILLSCAAVVEACAAESDALFENCSG